MTDRERIDEWHRYYKHLSTDAAKWALFSQLKRGDAADRRAMEELVAIWLKEGA